MEEETHTHAIRRACFVTVQFSCNNWVIYVMQFQSDQDRVHRHIVQTKPRLAKCLKPWVSWLVT